MLTQVVESTARVASRAISVARVRKLRKIRQFAIEEMIVPPGSRYPGRLRIDRQPYVGLYLDAVDSGLFRRFAAVGPTQSGKTLTTCLLPMLWHLFEWRENVIFGIPDIKMAADKWEKDILPAIQATRYVELMPIKGEGSRSGTVKRAVTFQNGATLRFMGGGGTDKTRSGYTARIVVITEADGMDEPGLASRETDKIGQLEARTMSFNETARIYMECTASIDKGRIWQEYQAGTRSIIVRPCPHCQVWVSPERKHLVNWKHAESEAQAGRDAHFVCPSCAEPWTDQQRKESTKASRLVHHGQRIDKNGDITGEPRDTETLGFRWSHVDNLFMPSGYPARLEWRKIHDENISDPENIEKEICQFFYATPYSDEGRDEVTQGMIRSKAIATPKGILPDGTYAVTVGIDVGKFICHWTALAWHSIGCVHVHDYGAIEVPTEALGAEKALLVALREFADVLNAGWQTVAGVKFRTDNVLVDGRWLTEVVFAFCREQWANDHDDYWPSLGYGHNQQTSRYVQPRKLSPTVIKIGNEYHTARTAKGIKVVHVNADKAKTWVHNRILTPIGQPGSMTLYQAESQAEHDSFAKHLTAEKRVNEFVPGKGLIEKWVAIRKANHKFDSTAMACIGGLMRDISIIEESEDKPTSWLSEQRRTEGWNLS